MAIASAEKQINAWSVVLLLSVAFVVNYIDRQVVFSIFPVLRRELSFSDAQLGIAGSLFTWTYSLSMPLTGRLADLVPRHRMIIAALALWSIATAGTGLSQSFGQFLFWRFMMGITEALYIPAAVGMITKVHPGQTRSRALSIHGLAQFTGITLGGWYGGWAGETIGWRWGFAMLAAVGCVYAWVLAKQFRGFEGWPEKSGHVRSAPSEVFRSWCYLVLCATFFSFNSVLWMLYAWLPNHVYETFHLSLAESGFTATIYLQGGSAIGALLGGALSDYASKRTPAARFWTLIGGLLLSSPFAYLVFQTSSLPMMKLGACGFGLFAGFFIANLVSSAYDIVRPRNFGFAIGLLNMIGGLGGGAAVLLTGFFKHSVGTGTLMLYCAASSMLLALILLVTVRSRFEQERFRPAETA